MNIIEKSLELALKAHSGQVDKAGQPYILHPLRVMSHMDCDMTRAAALLHDVLEDSDISEDNLLSEGIPPVVVDAVKCLTKAQNENYSEFIERVLSNTIAAKVKKADIEDNLNILRIDMLREKDLERIKKYHKAWKKLAEKLKSL
jgi:(p)ppGpp synthase/HD superfamily hydrolase